MAVYEAELPRDGVFISEEAYLPAFTFIPAHRNEGPERFRGPGHHENPQIAP